MPDVSQNTSAQADTQTADKSSVSTEDQIYTHATSGDKTTDNPSADTSAEGADKSAKADDDAAKSASEGDQKDQQLADDKKAEADKAAAEAAAAKAISDAVEKLSAEDKAKYEKMSDEEKAKFIKDKIDAEKPETKKGEPLDLSDVKIEMPEGMELDKGLVTELGTLAGELGLDKEGATKLLPLGVKLAENVRLKTESSYATLRQGWRDEIAADKEIGGAENLKITNKGLEVYGTPALRKLLDDSGLGDAPEIHRHFHKLGLSVSEDVVEKGGSGDKTKTDTSVEDIMYPTMRDKR